MATPAATTAAPSRGITTMCGRQLISCDCDIPYYVESPPKKKTAK